MRYRVLVEIKAARVVTLQAESAAEALRKAEKLAFPNPHARDKVKSLVMTGYPKKSPSGKASKPSVQVP